VATVWSIVVAGGSGRRFGEMKQFALLRGRPVLEHAVAASRACSAGVVLVVPAAHEDAGDHGADHVVRGGPTRADSVRRGLDAVPMEAEVIVVHDAARPLASRALFEAVIRAVRDGGADGAVPGLPLSDTIKAVDATGRVTRTLDRDALVAVQTPQAFRADVLRRAHAAGARADAAATDDAMLVEALGAAVQVVPGERRNLKITGPDDLIAAEQLLVRGED
jgi:2-C-methyl-D-erythritol 4-phosphate cytidylyltransferase